MSGPQIQLALWVSQPVLQTAVAAVILRRKLFKEFPAFFTYTVVQVLIFCVEYPVFFWFHPTRYFNYFYVYWISAALNVVLSFKIIHEIFLDIFRPYPALKDFGTSLFKWAGIVLILFTVVVVIAGPRNADPITGSILVVQRCVDLVLCGLVIFLLAFCRSLKVSWQRLSFGIVLGFGTFSSAELLTSAMFSGTFVHSTATNIINMGAFDIGSVTWLMYAIWNRRDKVLPVLVPQRWDEALTDLRPPQTTEESLIPMFEHMVDRALSRAQDSHPTRI